MALTRIISAIYEADFLDCSYGFRPNRCIHDALRQLNLLIETRKVSYVVDADIKGFFDHVDHEWLMKFLSQRIVDPNIHWIIRRILKAGYMEAEKLYETTEGTPQGGNCSPVLANIYLHYVLDLWFEKIIKKECHGEAYMVRYADDCAPRRRRAARQSESYA
jgi:group II intron reverse transcriptase/maturase